MLKLRYAVENRRGGALLCGASGSGKTLLVQQLRKHLGKDCQPVAHVVFPQMPADQLKRNMEQIAAILASRVNGMPLHRISLGEA